MNVRVLTPVKVMGPLTASVWAAPAALSSSSKAGLPPSAMLCKPLSERFVVDCRMPPLSVMLAALKKKRRIAEIAACLGDAGVCGGFNAD